MKKREKNKISIFGSKNPIFAHLITYQKYYLFCLLLIVLLIPFITSYTSNEPTLKGQESYYHLSLSNTYENITLNPLHLLLKVLPFAVIIFIPLILAISNFILFYLLADKINLSKEFTFFFMLFSVLSPGVIFTFSTLSLYGFFIQFVLLGFLCFSYEKRTLSVICFILASTLEVVSSMVLILLLILLMVQKKKEAFTFLTITCLILLITTFIGTFYFNQLTSQIEPP